MATIERNAESVWRGSLTGGEGLVTFVSGAIKATPVTWASRVEDPAGKTSPEELIAAAHAACYCMGLSNILAEKGTPPDRLHVAATCRATKDEAGFRITGMHLDVRGKVGGIDADGFAAAAAEAAAGCPVSQLLGKGLEITHTAVLEV
jgi:osmotically inducible protein OsmC